jgi:dTDP-glucose 4,6-dehydratase
MMQNVLVTGGAGFIGSNFVRYVLEAEPHMRVINLDALTYAGSLRSGPAGQGSLYLLAEHRPDRVADLRQHRVDTIVTLPPRPRDRPSSGRAFIRTNVMGTFTLLEAARQFWLVEKALPLEQARFHHVSTDEVYGTLGPDDPAFSEVTPYAPNSPYAASKAGSDHIARSYIHTFGLPITISNCSNNYGPCQFPEKLIPLMVLNAQEGKPLPVYGDGQQIRDWLYVGDHARIPRSSPGAGRRDLQHRRNQPANLTIVRPSATC